MTRFYLLLLCTGISLLCHSQTPFSPESKGYYTIVGAFAIKQNANKFNATLHKNGINSSYGYLASQNIYYVYTTKNEDASVCLKEMEELRKKPEFWDAWVRYIGDGPNPGETRITEETTIAASEQPAANGSETAVHGPPVLEKDEQTEEEELDAPPVSIPLKPTLANTEIFLSLYNATNDKVANGKVQVVDTDRGRLIKEVPGNTYLLLPDPKNGSGSMSLICDVFGYRKVQKEINFNNPTADTSFIVQMGSSLIANFELVRYQKGDIQTLYNIYFYNDAAVMMPESKYELNSLMEMLKENPGYRIRLHGHTNGNYHGKIIRVAPGGDYFSVAKDANTSIGSAKELSESRAGVIRDYLVSQGIDGSRVEIKAWGGKRPLYDKHSANAKKNIRVEVEILND
jgi:outer membrane protein OmpA-like peptidoglycan-associated protein